MSMTVNEAREMIAENVGDPTMLKVNRDHLLNFLNRASRDLRNLGWLLPIEPALVGLEENIYEYDVPSRFAYIQVIRYGSISYDNASTQDTGVDVSDTGGISAADTEVGVTDGSIFVVNDHIQLESEAMLITAIVSNTLTIRRAQFGTTAAAHADATDVLRPMTDVDYDQVIPRAYWYLKQATGGMSSAQASRASRPLLVLNQDYFSFTNETPLQIHGQRRPTEVYASGDSLDDQMESFILERATAYTARFLFAQGDHPHLQQVFRDAWAMSEQFIGAHPQEFRVYPSSTHVPGR